MILIIIWTSLVSCSTSCSVMFCLPHIKCPCYGMCLLFWFRECQRNVNVDVISMILLSYLCLEHPLTAIYHQVKYLEFVLVILLFIIIYVYIPTSVFIQWQTRWRTSQTLPESSQRSSQRSRRSAVRSSPTTASTKQIQWLVISSIISVQNIICV